MHALKSSLLVLASIAFLGCPGEPPKVKPDPKPDPKPEQPFTPCGSTTQGLMSSAQARMLAPAEPRLLPAEPDAEGRVGVLVAFRPGRYAPEVVEGLGLTVTGRLPTAGAVTVRVNAGERAALEAHPDIRLVKTDRTVRNARVSSVPVPGPWLGQVGPVVSEITWGLRMVQAPQVWDADEDGVVDDDAPAGQGITVCVLDSGVDRAHPEIEAMYAGGWDFVDGDDNPDDSTPFFANNPVAALGGGHGTHVQGTIAARYGSPGVLFPGMAEGGVVGVAPRARMLTARVLGTEGTGATSGIIAGLDWCAAQGAQIVSLSLGSDENSELEREAVNRARAAGALVIAASGNNDGSTVPHYPAAHPGVMAVGAVDSNMKRASFSQRGQHLSVVGPGVDVLSSTVRGSGTYSRLTMADDTELASNALSGSGVGTYDGTLVDCGLADSWESCKEGATCGGFVALVRRGGSTFAEKAAFVLGQGAKAVIIANNDAADTTPGNFTLGDGRYSAPVLSVSTSDGDALLAQVGQPVSVGLVAVDYALESGTSMATPHVSGVAALVWSAKPSLTGDQVRKLLECSARYLGAPGAVSNIGTGYGLVQTQDALAKLALWDAEGWPTTGCGAAP